MQAAQDRLGRRYLSLDGGGVRGLATLYILEQILSAVGNPRPCDFFQVIGGTSTGGLIAIMLGCLKMSVSECIDRYTEMMDYVFDRPRHRPSFRARVNPMTLNVRARYSQKRLEKKILEVIANACETSNQDPSMVKMRREDEPICKTFVVVTAFRTTRGEIFTNYRPQGGEQQSAFYNAITIREAALATTAATTFFDPFLIDHGVPRIYVDGAFYHNNPVNLVLREARNEFGSQLSDAEFENEIQCLLSLGTGEPGPTALYEANKLGWGDAFSLVDSLEHLATEADKTAMTFQDNHLTMADRNAYMRFDLPYMDNIGLADAKKKGEIADLAAAYGSKQRLALSRFARAAGGNQSPLMRNDIPVTYSRRLFTDLIGEQRSVDRRGSSYWSHFTVPGLEKYAAMWSQLCKLLRRLDKPEWKIGFTHNEFRTLFDSNNPPEQMSRRIWRRLLRPEAPIDNTRFPKGFVIAAIYMLHIEIEMRPILPPLVDQSLSRGPRLSHDQRSVCKFFGDWQTCLCGEGCGREWNFANINGLSRNGRPAKRCPVAEAVERQSKSQEQNHDRCKEEAAWVRTRTAWETRKYWEP